VKPKPEGVKPRPELEKKAGGGDNVRDGDEVRR
jgi:hypothetical protein